MTIRFTIPLQPVTKKNSPQILTNHKTGKQFVAPSKQYKEYEQSAMWFMPYPYARKPIDYPVQVKCLFYVKDERNYDLTNLLEAIDDIMVKRGLLKDDCYKILVHHDGSRVFVDRTRPRTEVYIRDYIKEEDRESKNE